MEKRKAVATIKRLENNLKKAQIENEHLKKATNQSEVGRAWDGEMADFIRGVFGPLGDQVETTPGSRKGDVIHNMHHDGALICPVIIENKSGQEITLKFIRQASEAKRVRKARYALLVSDGKRAGFEGGIKIEGDVILVKPAALISLLHIIRDVHVELARAKASTARIDEVSENLMAFIRGQEFRAPMAAIVKAAVDLESHLTMEKDQIGKWWELRLTRYRQIGLDGAAIQSAVHAILESKSKSNLVPLRRLRRVS